MSKSEHNLSENYCLLKCKSVLMFEDICWQIVDLLKTVMCNIATALPL